MEIHDIAFRIVKYHNPRNSCDDIREDSEEVDWGDNHYRCELGGLVFYSWESNSGVDDIGIEYEGRSVYEYKSDGVEGHVERYEEGEWENELIALYTRLFPLEAKRNGLRPRDSFQLSLEF